MSRCYCRRGFILLLCLVLPPIVATGVARSAEIRKSLGPARLAEDDMPPEIVCPPDVLYECDNVGDFGAATATDNMDPSPSIRFSDRIVFQRCPYEYTMVRTWMAMDASGNTSRCRQMIEIMDSTPPEFTYCPPDTVVDCEAGIANLPHATATDNCNPEPDIQYEAIKVPGQCPNEYKIVRSWQVHDGCCNVVFCQQVVTVRDDSPPILTCGPDGRLGCNEPAVFTEPVAADNCDPHPTVEMLSDTVEPGPEMCEETHTRCWVARDACGNTSEPVCQTIVRMVDTEPPVLICAPDKTVPFGSPVIFDEPEVTDNCLVGGELQALSSLAEPAAGDLATFTQCWIVVDECGNVSNECCQIITVEAEPDPYCTFACWDWGTACLEEENRDISTKPACIRDEYFYDVFPQGVVIGDPSRYTATWTSPEAVEEYGCGYGIPWPLRRDYIDPERNELGVLAGEILALRLNREFSCAGYLGSLGYGGPDACYGAFVIPDSVLYFGGLTVDEFLEVADQGVAGNTAAVRAYGANINHLWATATYLNWLYSDCGGRFIQSPAPPGLTSDPEGEDTGEPVSEVLPERLEITVRPNPLQAGTAIRLAIPAEGAVSLAIYDINGRLVATVFDGRRSAGLHTFMWKGIDQWGRTAAGGVYFCRASFEGKPAVMQKMVKM